MFAVPLTCIPLDFQAVQGPVLGPLLGGFAIQAKNWRWVRLYSQYYSSLRGF